MRQKFLTVLAIAALLGAIGGCSEQRVAALENQLEGIEAIEDPAERSEAALAFVIENASRPEELEDLLERGVETAVSSATEAGGPEAGFEVWEALYAAEATPDRHYYIMARYDRALVETGEPDRIARAEELARELLDADDAPGMPYIWMTYFHSSSDLTDKELVVDVARAGYANAEPEDAGTWPSMLDRAYGAYVGEMSMTEGLDVALERAEVLAVGADDPIVAGALRANIYRLAIEDSPGTATAAARAIAASEDFSSWQILNDVAYDMAERDVEPDLAVELSERALALAPSRYDSAMVLDTAGWAMYRTGDTQKAADYLEQAVSLLEETPTFDNTLVPHLVEVYRSGGMDDLAIDFLAVIVARSVDADDPARALLARMLTRRDGSAAALDDLVAERRYEGVITAPAFALPNRAGETVALADLEGDVVLVSFWGYGCGPCRAELPRLVELYDRFEDMGVQFVSIDAGQRPPAAEGFLDENNVRHIVLNDADRSVRDAYKVTGIPVTVIIDHEGRIIYRHLGFAPGDEERTAKEIETLIAWRDTEA